MKHSFYNESMKIHLQFPAALSRALSSFHFRKDILSSLALSYIRSSRRPVVFSYGVRYRVSNIPKSPVG